MHKVPAEGLKIWGCNPSIKRFLRENILLLFLQYIRVAIVPLAPPVPLALYKVGIALPINISCFYVQVFNNTRLYRLPPMKSLFQMN